MLIDCTRLTHVRFISIKFEYRVITLFGFEFLVLFFFRFHRENLSYPTNKLQPRLSSRFEKLNISAPPACPWAHPLAIVCSASPPTYSCSCVLALHSARAGERSDWAMRWFSKKLSALNSARRVSLYFGQNLHF